MVNNKKIANKEDMIDQSYTVNDLEHLGPIEAIRMRPGMYIRGVGEAGLFQMIDECISNSIDESSMGFGDVIDVVLNDDGSVSIRDYGRGIPVGMHKSGRPSVEMMFTVLHKGAKMKPGAYYRSGGLHGIALTIINALSKWVEIEIWRDGNSYIQRFEGGKPAYPIKITGKSTITGTKITFFPDAAIFTDIRFNYKSIQVRMQELAYLNKGISLRLIKKGKTQVFLSKKGLTEYVGSYVQEGLISPPISINENFGSHTVEICLNYADNSEERIFGFVNNIKTSAGGTHVEGFRSGITYVMNEFAKKNGLMPKGVATYFASDVREGIVAIVHVKLPDPIFIGQSKGSLDNTETQSIVREIVVSQISMYLAAHLSTAKKILAKINENAKLRVATKKAREAVKKSKGNGFGLLTSSKLADAISNDPTERELFIVEGDSAGGTSKSARDRETMSVLGLRGVPLNAWTVDFHRIIGNEELNSLVSCIGGKVEGKKFVMKSLMYHKIIINTDADIDGEHIRVILLGFFYKFFPELIESGYLYVARPPLYKIKCSKKEYYCYSDVERDSIIKRLGDNKAVIQRYKGLGEMNADELWETTMDPETRTMYKITVDDAKKAAQLLNILIGVDAAKRREYIYQHASEAEGLDI